MARLNVIILFLVVGSVGFVSTMIIRQPDPYCDNIDNYCGSRLADELQIICRDKYNELPAGEDESIAHGRRLGMPLVTKNVVISRVPEKH